MFSKAARSAVARAIAVIPRRAIASTSRKARPIGGQFKALQTPLASSEVSAAFPSFATVANANRKRPSNAKEAVEYARENGAVMADLKFADLYGLWHHLQINIAELDEGAFERGFGFDGSSIRGWQAINESDMLLLLEPSSAIMDPFAQHPTVSFICNILQPHTKEDYSRDPRNVARKAVKYLRSTGIAHDMYAGPECEFFIFDSARYNVSSSGSFYEIDSSEAHWNSGKHTTGYRIRQKEGYFPVKPWDTLQDLRTEIVQELVRTRIHVEASHHEVASAGQCEIDIRFSDLVSAADNILWYKYVVRNVAHRHGKTVTFMPKPIADDNGSGMHTHVSLHLKDGTNLFTGDKYAGLSQMALHFTGGLIHHAKSLCAITNPTVNSYKRLVPGFEAPVNMAYSGRNRSAAIRIPISHPKARRLEYRTPDPATNPYLSFSAIMLAGLDGIQKKISPGEPLDKDIYSLSPEEARGIPQAPGSLDEAIKALEDDHEYLLKGDVFTKDLVETWIERKKEFEINPARKAPTPIEYKMYFDC